VLLWLPPNSQIFPCLLSELWNKRNARVLKINLRRLLLGWTGLERRPTCGLSQMLSTWVICFHECNLFVSGGVVSWPISFLFVSQSS
jgi:hypothetical protein